MSLRRRRVKVNLRRDSGTRYSRRKLAVSRVILVRSIRAQSSISFVPALTVFFSFSELPYIPRVPDMLQEERTVLFVYTTLTTLSSRQSRTEISRLTTR